MHFEKNGTRLIVAAMAAAGVFSLAGRGVGGGGDTSLAAATTPAPAPAAATPQTTAVAITIVDGPIRNATVCLDRDAMAPAIPTSRRAASTRCLRW